MDYEKITHYVTEPRLMGEMENADGRGAVGDPSCGDRVEIFIKVKDDHITDIRYRVKGCWGPLPPRVSYVIWFWESRSMTPSIWMKRISSMRWVACRRRNATVRVWPLEPFITR